MTDTPTTHTKHSLQLATQVYVYQNLDSDGKPTEIDYRDLADSLLSGGYHRFYACSGCDQRFMTFDEATGHVTTDNESLT